MQPRKALEIISTLPLSHKLEQISLLACPVCVIVTLIARAVIEKGMDLEYLVSKVSDPQCFGAGCCSSGCVCCNRNTLSDQSLACRAGKNLQAQYERWQPRAKYKTHLDPTMDDVKKLAISCRRTAKVLTHPLLLTRRLHPLPHVISYTRHSQLSAHFSISML